MAKTYKHGRDRSLPGKRKGPPSTASGKPPGPSFASLGKVPASSTSPGLPPLELNNQRSCQAENPGLVPGNSLLGLCVRLRGYQNRLVLV